MYGGGFSGSRNPDRRSMHPSYERDDRTPRPEDQGRRSTMPAYLSNHQPRIETPTETPTQEVQRRMRQYLDAAPHDPRQSSADRNTWALLATVNDLQREGNQGQRRLLNFAFSLAQNLPDLSDLPQSGPIIAQQILEQRHHMPETGRQHHEQYQYPENEDQLINNPPPGSLHEMVRNVAGTYWDRSLDPYLDALNTLTLAQQERYWQERYQWRAEWQRRATQQAGSSFSTQESFTGGELTSDETITLGMQQLRMGEQSAGQQSAEQWLTISTSNIREDRNVTPTPGYQEDRNVTPTPGYPYGDYRQ